MSYYRNNNIVSNSMEFIEKSTYTLLPVAKPVTSAFILPSSLNSRCLRVSDTRTSKRSTGLRCLRTCHA